MTDRPASRNPSAEQACGRCGVGISRWSKTGHCRSCVFKVPEIAAKRSAAIKRAFMADPMKRERQRRGVAEANRRPEARERARRRAIESRIWEKGVEAMTPEVRERIGRTQTEQRLAHIPLERRAEYKKLVKEIGAAEATRVILAHHEAVLRRGRA